MASQSQYIALLQQTCLSVWTDDCVRFEYVAAEKKNLQSESNPKTVIV